MDKAIIGGIVRAGLASVGGYLVSKGYATSADVETLATNASAVVGVALYLAVWPALAGMRPHAPASHSPVVMMAER